jgi:hypothetical protein
MHPSYPLSPVIFFLSLCLVGGCAALNPEHSLSQAIVQSQADTNSISDKGVIIQITQHSSILVDPMPIFNFSLIGLTENRDRAIAEPRRPWMVGRFAF